MPPGAGNGHTVQQFKEIKVQSTEQGIGGACIWVEFAPCIECSLSLPKNLINGFLSIQLFVDKLRITFIRK